jgi:hypothetical protein
MISGFAFSGNPIEMVAYCTGKAGWPGESIAGVKPVADCDGDGVADEADNCPDISNSDQLNTDRDEAGNLCDLDDDGDEVPDADDAFPLDSNESVDSDGDSIGNNADADDDNDGVTDEQELIDGTNPLDALSCSGCNSVFDVDADGEVKALTDGLLLIRYFFGLTGDALVRGAVNGDGNRTSAEEIESYLESHMP